MDVSISAAYRQNKAFQERVYYWMRKGLPREEAECRARSPRRRLSLVPNLLPPRSEARNPGSAAIQGRAESSQHTCLPNQEIQVSGIQPVATGHSVVRQVWMAQAQSGQTQEPGPNVCQAVQAVFCVSIVLCATGLLVESSAEVLGGSVQAWIKAILLELGILGLAAYRAKGMADLLVSKLGAAFLIALSLLVLHAGVRSSESEALTAAESSSDALKSLKEERSRLLETNDALPADHATRRAQLMTEVRTLSGRIDSERQNAAEGRGAKVIAETHLVEGLVRLALVFLNLTFCHGLVTSWRRAAHSASRAVAPNLEAHGVETCGLKPRPERGGGQATAS